MRIIIHSILACIAVVVCSGVPDAQAVPIGTKVTYHGKGAGEVIFDGSVHGKAYACAECHEENGLVPPLFVMKSYANGVSMRKMEMGLSCGKCHAISMKNTATCSLCHHK